MTVCSVPWCDKVGHGRFCAGHWTNYRKHGVPCPPSLALRIGRRTLLAKTCPLCGELKVASAFKSVKGRRHTYCTPCQVVYNRSHRSHRRKQSDAAARFIAERQMQSLPNATRHYERYTDKDWIILLDDNLSMADKSRILNRTFHAIADVMYKHHKKIKEDGG